mgnify:CR=1 FL=1
MTKKSICDTLRRTCLILAGSFIMAVNLKSFVRAGGLIPGGFNGLTRLIQEISVLLWHWEPPFSVINFILNAVPVVISFKFIGKKFTGYSCLMIVVSGILTDMVPAWPVTEDILLIAIFGGLINALAISLCLFANATSGGTDFIAIFFSEKKGIDTWNYIFMGNVAVLLIAGCIYGMNVALYSIIFQYASTQMINMMYKRYDKDTLFIITKKPDEVYNIILKKTNHDATLFKGVGCYKNEEKAMLYSVVNSDATRVLVMDIKKEDPEAFINYFGSKGIRGNFYYQEED